MRTNAGNVASPADAPIMPTIVRARKVPNMKRSPWAKLISSTMP